MTIHGISLREQKLTQQLKGTQNVLDDTITELNELKSQYEKLKDDFVIMSQLRVEDIRKCLLDALDKRKV